MSSRLILLFLFLLSASLNAQTRRQPFEDCDPDLHCIEFAKILQRTIDFLDAKEGGKAYEQLKALVACTNCPEHQDNLDALSAEIIELFEVQNDSLQGLFDQVEAKNKELDATVGTLQNRTNALKREREKVSQQLAINEEMTRQALVNKYISHAREALKTPGAIGAKNALWLTDFTYHYVDSTHHSVQLMLHDLIQDRIHNSLPYDLYNEGFGREARTRVSDDVPETEVLAMAWSSDEQWLAAGTDENRLLLFDASGNVVLDQINGGYAKSLAWKPDEPTLVYTKNMEELGMVSYINKEWLERPISAALEYPIIDMAWSPDGKQLALISDDGYLYIWNPSDGEPPQRIGSHEATISDLAWSPDGEQLVTSDHSGAISFWLVTHQQLRFRRTGHSDYARTVDWHPDGNTIVSGGDDAELIFWNTNGQITGRQSFPTWVMNAAYSPSGERIAVTTLDEEVHIVTVSGSSINRFFLPIGVKKAAWRGEISTADPNGGLLVSFDENAAFRLSRSLKMEQRNSSFTQRNGDLIAGYIGQVAWSPDGAFLAYGKDYELVMIGPEKITRFDLVGAGIYDIDWHPGLSKALPQTNFMATVGSNNRLIIWDVPSETIAQERQLQIEGLAVAWSPDGQYLAVGNTEGGVQLFNTRLELIASATLHSDYVRSLSWSPNGLYLASASDDHTCAIYDVRNAERVAVLEAHNDWVRKVLWLDNLHLVSAGDDAKTILWEWMPEDKEIYLLQTLERIDEYHKALAFIPQRQGGVLAVGSTSSEVALWHIEPNWEARFDTIFQLDQAIEGLDWHPNGRNLVMNTFATVPYELGWDSTLSPAYDGTNKPVHSVVVDDAFMGATTSIFDAFYLPELKVEPRLYDQIAWSNDEHWLAVIQQSEGGNSTKYVELHDAQYKKIVRTLTLVDIDPVQLLFSPDGHYLAITPNEGDVVVIPTDSTREDRLLLEMRFADTFIDWAWSSDSRYLAILDRSFQVHIHDLTTGSIQYIDSGAAEYDLGTITFYPLDNRWLYLFTQQGVYELDRQVSEKGKRVYAPPVYNYILGDIGGTPPKGEWLANGKEVLYRQADNPPILLSLQPGHATVKVVFGENENLHTWSTKGGVLHGLERMPPDKPDYTSSELEYPLIWSLDGSKVRGRLQPARWQLIEDIVLSTDGHYLLTRGALLQLRENEDKYVAYNEPSVIIWDVNQQEKIFELAIPGGLMAGFSPLGNYVYVYYESGRVMLWPLNISAISQFLANSGKDRYLEQLFPDGNRGFVDRITDWELESGINFKDQHNLKLLRQRERAAVRKHWSTYFADQVWVTESEEVVNEHFAKAISLHTEQNGRAIRSSPADTSAVVNIWFEQAYYAIYNQDLNTAAAYIRQIVSLHPESTQARMLAQLLAWHQGQRAAVIRTLFSVRREDLIREINNWEYRDRDLNLKDKTLLKRYIALSAGQQDPSTPTVEPQFISTIPQELTATFRDSLVRSYYSTNMQHESFEDRSGNRFQQFLKEAVDYLEKAWKANPQNTTIPYNLASYINELALTALAKGKLDNALAYTNRRVEIFETLLEQGRESYQKDYLQALSESINIRLQQNPTRAAALRKEIVAARKRFPKETTLHNLDLQQAHCEILLGKAKAAYHIYYEVLQTYPYAIDEVIRDARQVITPAGPERWDNLAHVFDLFVEYQETVTDYDESVYALEDPSAAITSSVLSEAYWGAYNAAKVRFEAALTLESEDMMPVAALQGEMNLFNDMAATYAHVLLLNGTWRELPTLLATTEKYLYEYNWPQAMTAIVSLMEGEWRISQRLLRRISGQPNDGYLIDDYPHLRDYLRNLPDATTSISAFQERKEDWLRALNE